MSERAEQPRGPEPPNRHSGGLGTARAELPQPITSLIGREAEIAAVVALFERTTARLVTLTGPGGIGKTRLALAAAGALHERFADGVRFVPLASLTDPGLVIPTIAHALEIGERPHRGLLEGLVDHLREQRALLVLDNFEHLIAASTDIARLLVDCRELRVMITSREPLNLTGEHEYQVPPLQLPEPQGGDADARGLAGDAVELFVERASQASPGFCLTADNAAVLAEICRRLDGLPLALELAAARIKLLSPEELLKRLDQPLALLTGGPRDAPPRQQTMRGTLQWSYDLLAPEEQTLFRCLAIFVGGWTLSIAEALVATDGTLERLAALVDKGLLRRRGQPGGGTRYGMLQPVLQFARERLEERNDEFEAIRERHAGYFLEFVDDLRRRLDRADGAALFELVEAELDNVRAALQGLRERGDVERSLKLTGHLLPFLAQRGHITEGWALAQAVLSMPGAERRTPERARVLWMVGRLSVYRRAEQLGIQLSDEARAISRDCGNRAGMAEALFSKGMCLEVLDEVEQACVAYECALGLFREVGDAAMIVRVLSHLGQALMRQGDHQRARPLLEEAVTLARNQTLPNVTALALGMLHEIAERSGNDLWVLELLEERLRILREFSKPTQLADTLDQFASLLVGHGRAVTVVSLLSAAATLRDRSGAMAWTSDTPWAVEVEEAALRASLSERAFAEAWERGRAMDLTQAAEFALQALETHRARERPAGLTSREIEILSLLAAGKSNRQIAAELYLSARTIERHVANIYTKIDVHNRAEATAFALGHGIA